MAIEEKLGQLVYNAPAIPRLGIPAYNWWGEALHSIARNGRATVFPRPSAWRPPGIPTRSSVSPQPWAMKAVQISRHAAPLWRDGPLPGADILVAQCQHLPRPALGPRPGDMGRRPLPTGELGAALSGAAGDHPRYLKAAACAKHYAVHSGPESKRTIRRPGFAARSPRDLPAGLQEAGDRGQGRGGHGRVQPHQRRGVLRQPALLGDILRGEWGFEGHVVSDCGALDDLHTTHGITADAAESAALAVDTAATWSAANLRGPGRGAPAGAAKATSTAP